MNYPLSYKYYTLLTFCLISSCLLFILVASETITKNSEDSSPPSIAGSTKIEETTGQNDNFETTTVLHEEIDKTAASKPDVLMKSDQIPVETIEKIQIKALPIVNATESETENKPVLENISEQQIPRPTLASEEVPAIQEVQEIPNKTESSQHKNVEKEKPNNNNKEEEHPIPVFSEWAQQQMQEAEKKQEEHQNATFAKNNVNATKAKIQVIKLRAKNYASPDCGAKILIANPEAQSTASVLSAHKDEYLLSPCTSRIWFVVELCEPIQAERIELANFELFSSSPKDVSISISNRFPTRDWTNVGKFTAKDERDIQTFDLSPHLFGKFVKVDVLSHYNSEHFCPLSLFKVFGTSEFEAFETENQPGMGSHIDDFDDEHDMKKDDKKNDNLFNRAGEAVLNIVKKAAEVLVKREDQTHHHQIVNVTRAGSDDNCMSLAHNPICMQCTEKQHSDLVDLLSCKQIPLMRLLKSSGIKSLLEHSEFCKGVLGFPIKEDDCQLMNSQKSSRNLFVEILSTKHLRSLCNLAGILEKKVPLNERIFKITENLRNPREDQKFEPVIELEDNKNLKNISKNDKLKPEVIQQKKQEVNEIKRQEKQVDTENKKNGEQQVVQEAKDSQGEKNSNDSVNIFNVVDSERKEKPKEVSSQNLDQNFVDSTIEVPPVVDSKEEKENTTNLSNGTWSEVDITVQENNNNQSAQNAQKNHPESVFLRLSNRIKALERNMSLSSQYLEELSKRYKKQVEELQQSFTKTILAIEEQNLRSQEQEQKNVDENRKLRENLTELTEKINNFENLVVFLGCFVVFQVLFLVLLIRYCARDCMHRKTPDEEKQTVNVPTKKKKERRRRSLNDICEQLIKDNSIANLSKVSCDDLNVSLHDFTAVKGETHAKKKSRNRTRKNSAPILMQQQQHQKLMKQNSFGLLSLDENSVMSEKKPNKNESVPKSTEKSLNGSQKSGVSGPVLEENDEIIMPSASDLSYNEFVPSDPHDDGMEAASIVSTDSVKTTSSKSDLLAKTRRLSSPTFLKSALSRKSSKKSSKNWDWYKLNRSSSSSEPDRKHKAKSESPSPRDRNDSVDTNGELFNGDINSKKTNGSFRRFLKKVF